MVTSWLDDAIARDHIMARHLGKRVVSSLSSLSDIMGLHGKSFAKWNYEFARVSNN